MQRTIHVVLNARLPHKKAYGIQSLQTCQSFIEQGMRVVLVCPSSASNNVSMRDFYKLRVDIEVIRIPSVSLYSKGKLLFIVSGFSFMLSSLLYLWIQKIRGKLDIVYTFDMDTFSFALLPLVGRPVFAEIHATKTSNVLSRFFFANARGIISVNPNIRLDFMNTFGIPGERVIVEPCGVDDSWLDVSITKESARQQLGLPADVRMAAFVGRFYSWKGLDILPAAAKHIPDTHVYIVGGSREEYIRATRIHDIPGNVIFPGEAANYDVPYWLSAADALVVVWPKHQNPFYRYMSPMKIYEYMALRRPVVGANEPTITNGIPGGEALLYEPGDAKDLALKIKDAIEGGVEVERMVNRAHALASRHTLKKRAERISAFMGIDLGAYK